MSAGTTESNHVAYQVIEAQSIGVPTEAKAPTNNPLATVMEDTATGT